LRIGRRRKVYRLQGAGPDSSAVIAKRSRKADALIERTIYEEILPRVTVPSLRYYGFLERSEEHTSELQSLRHLVCRLLVEKKNESDRTAATPATSGVHGPNGFLLYPRLPRDSIASTDGLSSASPAELPVSCSQ